MTGSRHRAAGLLLLALLAGCTGSGSGPEGARATPAATPSTASTPRTADLDALATALAAHPEPPSLDRELAQLRGRSASLSDDQWLVELMRITATRDRDGHTGVFPLAQPGLEVWPLQLYAFADGWRVVAAMPPYAGLVGGRVTKVGGVPVDQAVERLSPLVPHDNRMTVLARVAQWLVVPAVLRGAGLDTSLVVESKEVRPEPVPTAEFAEWSGAFYPLVVPRLPPVPKRDLALTTRGRSAVLSYSRVLAADGELELAVLAEQLTAKVASGEVERVVVDLRRNSGGENGTYPPLLRALQAIDAQRPGAVRVLFGRTTFSAATNFLAELLATTQTQSFGEAMGGAPNMWGDADEVTLPGSTLVVHVATRLWELGGKDLRPTIEPEQAVPVTWADHAAGRDVALAAALAAP